MSMVNRGMSQVEIALEFGGKVLIFPVNPEKVEITTEVNNNTTEIVGLGEIVEAGNPKVKQIKFESFIPDNTSSHYLPYMEASAGSRSNTTDFKQWIRNWIATKRPARLIIAGLSNINMLVLCDNFDYHHKGGDYEDLYYSLSFSSYVNYEPKRVQVNASKGSGATSTNRGLTVGAQVIVNGQLHLDSWGRGAGLTERNARRVITHIITDPTRAYPIHVALIGGTADESTRLSTWRGWVTKDSVRLV